MGDSLRDGLYMLSAFETRVLEGLDLVSTQVGSAYAAVLAQGEDAGTRAEELRALQQRFDRLDATLEALVAALVSRGAIDAERFDAELAAALERRRPVVAEQVAPIDVSTGAHPYRDAAPGKAARADPTATCQRCGKEEPASKLSHSSSGLICAVCLVDAEGG